MTESTSRAIGFNDDDEVVTSDEANEINGSYVTNF